jgi:hypothetical protein
MNNLYDYLIIRIYKWYEGFNNEPSLLTAKLLVAFHQTFLVLTVVNLSGLADILSASIFKLVSICLVIMFFVRLHLRYSDEDFFKSLLQKWRREEERIKTIKGYAISIILFLPFLFFVIISLST